MSRTELSLSDEWETPQELYGDLCKEYKINPELDTACNKINTKCRFGFTKEKSGLTYEWYSKSANSFDITYYDVWCNPPHKFTKAFVLKAHEQWKKHNINIMMLVPLQTLGRKYFNDIFDNYITPKKGVEWHRIQPRPTFIHPDQEKQENAKQEYIVIIWRKKK